MADTVRTIEIVNFPQKQHGEMAAKGPCPHCTVSAEFRQVVIHNEHALQTADRGRWNQRAAAICECVSCKHFILIVGTKTSLNPANPQTHIIDAPFSLDGAWPIATPSRIPLDGVPPDVADDYHEAHACTFVGAHKATVVMCRRVIESSANEQGATGANLVAKIDNLADKRKITQVLKDFAHTIRLTGNTGAHPDGLTGVTPDDASAMLEFTRQYLEHLYLMPFKLKSRKNSTPSAGPSVTASAGSTFPGSSGS